MATVKNFGLAGVGADVQFGKSGVHLKNDGGSFKFLNDNAGVAGTTLVNAHGAEPTESTHLTTKQYVDNVAAGLDPKESVRVATTGNIALSGLLTIDGVTVSAGDRVLVKNQSDAKENGIYVAASGAWARSTDMDGTPANEVASGQFTFVEQGTLYTNTGWVTLGLGVLSVGIDAINWAQFSGAGATTVSEGLGINVVQSGNNWTVTASVDDVTITNTGGTTNDQLAVRSTGTAGQVLRSTGTAGDDATWGQLDLANANAVTGVLDETNGGTGQNTFATGDILYASAANTLSKLAIATETGDNKKVLSIESGVPAWETMGLTNLDDVTVTTPVSDSILQYNGSQWVNVALTSIDKLTRVSANDTTSGYLDGKLVVNAAGALTKTILTPGGDEDLELKVNVDGATIRINAGNNLAVGNGTANYTLISGGAGADATWGQLSLTAGVTGVLPVENGGTERNTLTSGAVLVGNGTDPVTMVALGAANTYLGSTGSGDPAYSYVNALRDSAGAAMFDISGTVTDNTKLTVTSASSAATITASGTASDIDIVLTPKNSGDVVLDGVRMNLDGAAPVGTILAANTADTFDKVTAVDGGGDKFLKFDDSDNTVKWVAASALGVNSFTTISGNTGTPATADTSTDSISIVGDTATGITTAAADGLSESLTISLDFSGVTSSSVIAGTNEVLVDQGGTIVRTTVDNLISDAVKAWGTISGDTGSATADTSSDSITFVGGTGITTVASNAADTLTINLNVSELTTVSSVSGTNHVIIDQGSGPVKTTVNDLVGDTFSIFKTVTPDTGITATAGNSTDDLKILGGAGITTSGGASNDISIAIDFTGLPVASVISGTDKLILDQGGTVKSVTVNEIITDTLTIFKTVTTDSGSAVADNATDTLSILGGAGLATSATDTPDAVTINLDFAELTYKSSLAGTEEFMINDSGTVMKTSISEVVADAVDAYTTITGDSGSMSATTSTDTFKIAGGTAISTVAANGSPDTLTVDLDIAELTTLPTVVGSDEIIIKSGSTTYKTTVSNIVAGGVNTFANVAVGNTASNPGASSGTTSVADNSSDTVTLKAGNGINIVGDGANDAVEIYFSRDGMADTAVVGADTVPFFDNSASDQPEYRSFSGILADLDIPNAISADGFVVRTAADTYASRTIEVSSAGPLAGLAITNGNGVSGNPTVGLDIKNLTTSSAGLIDGSESIVVYDNDTDANFKLSLTDLFASSGFDRSRIGDGANAAADTTYVDTDASTETVDVFANSKQVAKFVSGASQNSYFEFDTGTAGEVRIEAAGSPADVDIRLVPKGNGDVIIGESGAGVIEADTDQNLTISGGDGASAGDLILEGGDGTGTNGNVTIRPGQGAGTDGQVCVYDSNGNKITCFVGGTGVVDTSLVVTNGNDKVTIATTGSTNSDIVLDPTGTGQVVVPSGYVVTANNSLVTKEYVDSAISSNTDELTFKFQYTGAAISTIDTFADVSGKEYIVDRVVVKVTGAFTGATSGGVLSTSAATFVTFADVDYTVVGTYIVDNNDFADNGGLALGITATSGGTGTATIVVHYKAVTPSN